MSCYLIFTLAGMVTVLGLLYLADEECMKRRQGYENCLHTELILYDAQSPRGDLSCTLYRTNSVIGRRKRRSDICLASYKDGRIERVHAILEYDMENFRIKPVFNPFRRRYTDIIVEHEVVPPQGRVIRYGERISIAGHILQLQNTNETARGVGL